MKIRSIFIGTLILMFTFCKQKKENREYKDFQYYEGFTIPKNEGFEYSKQCIFNTRKSKFIVQEYREYKQKVLTSSYSCLPEGKLDNPTSNKKNILLLKNDKLYFDDNEFEVIEISKDSIFGKNNESEILIIVK